jgi:AAA domain
MDSAAWGDEIGFDGPGVDLRCGGLDWHGRKNKGAAGVVYFALERADLVSRRLQAHGERMGLDNLPIAVVGSTIDLMQVSTVQTVIATIRTAEADFGCGVGLVIFDTFAKLIAAGGGDEDKARDQGKVFSNIQRVKEIVNAHVAIVGHTGKDESRGARGSNAILGDADFMVSISGETIKTASVIKANDAPEGLLFSFKSENHSFGTDEDGDPITVNIVSDDIVEASAGLRAGARWPKGLRLVHDAIVAALVDHGTEHRVAGDGPSVRAVHVTAAREVHKQRYVSNGDGDRNAAERQAWARNLRQAQSNGLISGENDLIWLVG